MLHFSFSLAILINNKGRKNRKMERVEELKKGKIYLVYDEKNRRMAVEKHLRGNFRLYEQLRKLSSPYLPKIYDVLPGEEETIIWEEYIQGNSLEQVPATEKQVTKWLIELCKVLWLLHSNHILHRDIKPSNILLGGDGHIRLIDFDAAREEKKYAENDTCMIGTRGYAAPEQYGYSQTDERTDIYAFGVTAQELLGKAAEKLRWKRILKKCTQFAPKKRYRHVWQIIWAIKFGKIRRRFIYPLTITVISIPTVFMLWSYVTDSDFRDVTNVILTTHRWLIFDNVDIDNIKKSDVYLDSYSGDVKFDYDCLKGKYPNEEFISTGYCSYQGYLLFGMFSKKYYISTGETYYDEFKGICYITEDDDVFLIPPDRCEQYAPAVLKLYNMDVFDTPIF